MKLRCQTDSRMPVREDVDRCEPPKPAEKTLEEFWKLEQQAEAMLEGLR